MEPFLELGERKTYLQCVQRNEKSTKRRVQNKTVNEIKLKQEVLIYLIFNFECTEKCKICHIQSHIEVLSAIFWQQAGSGTRNLYKIKIASHNKLIFSNLSMKLVFCTNKKWRKSKSFNSLDRTNSPSVQSD
jgi:hypothetical protein